MKKAKEERTESNLKKKKRILLKQMSHALQFE